MGEHLTPTEARRQAIVEALQGCNAKSEAGWGNEAHVDQTSALDMAVAVLAALAARDDEPWRARAERAEADWNDRAIPAFGVLARARAILTERHSAVAAAQCYVNEGGDLDSDKLALVALADVLSTDEPADVRSEPTEPDSTTRGKPRQVGMWCEADGVHGVRTRHAIDGRDLVHGSQSCAANGCLPVFVPDQEDTP